MKCHIILSLVLLLSASVPAEENADSRQKLVFMKGAWDSVSINPRTGEKTTGYSEIRWTVGGTWLQWKFTSQTRNGPLEVLTLINYQEEKKRYAFYSFNPYDPEPLPHFGRWVDNHTLRLKINEKNGETWVEFKPDTAGGFIQTHFHCSEEGKLTVTGRTLYTRTKGSNR